MENPGETLVGDYLRYIRWCDFVNYNVHTKTVQGEIDVIEIKNQTKEVFICEVATHLTTGFMYVNPKDSKTDSVARLLAKFEKDIEYGQTTFEGYRTHYMFWSPVITDSKGEEKNNQFIHLNMVKDGIQKKLGIEIEISVNEKYLKAIQELRVFASKETKELKSSIMRFLQIEEYSLRNVERLNKSKNSTPHRTRFDSIQGRAASE